MDRQAWREALLEIMERKDHWAWPKFTSGQVSAKTLHIHFEQEYATYVRDFAIFLGRAYVQCPSAAVRRELAANLYEEETGALSVGHPHAELFLRYPKGLDMNLARFENVQLLPAAARYRAFLDEATLEAGWEVATAVTTLFLEGTNDDRSAIEPKGTPQAPPPLADHPLVKHYGLPIEALELTRAHRMVEGDHRISAWHIVVDHVEPLAYAQVLVAMQNALDHWLDYRDDVARACGL